MLKCQKKGCTPDNGPIPDANECLLLDLPVVLCRQHQRAVIENEDMINLGDWDLDMRSHGDVLLAMCRGGGIDLKLAESNRQEILKQRAKYYRERIGVVYAWLDTPDAPR